MPTDSGFSNQKMRGPARHQTLQTMGSDRVGIPTAQMYLYEKTPVAIQVLSVTKTSLTKQTKKEYLTELLIEFDGPHNAQKFDIMRMMDGTLEGWEFEIIKVVDATKVIVYNIGDIDGVEQLPAVADAVKTLRWTTALSDQSGALQVSQGPLQFVRDSATIEVSEDTADETNNRPLPTGMYILKDGVAWPVSIDSVDPSQSVMVPVVVSGLSGPINITAGDLNVQLSDMSPNFDATRIGDGSGVYLKIEADGSITSNDPAAVLELQNVVTELQTLNTAQAAALVELVSINGKDFATQVTLAALLAAFNAEDFASQTTLAALLAAFNAEDFATQATQELNRLQLVALNAKDFATQTTLAALLAAFNAEDFASQTTLAALEAKFGTLGQKASAGSAPVVLSTAQETILTSLATKLDTLITSNSNRTLDSVVNVITSSYPLNAPANAKGFIIQNATSSAGALRFGKTGTTVNATQGFYLGVGQSTSYINGAASLKIFDVDGAGIDASIIWFT